MHTPAGEPDHTAKVCWPLGVSVEPASAVVAALGGCSIVNASSLEISAQRLTWIVSFRTIRLQQEAARAPVAELAGAHE